MSGNILNFNTKKLELRLSDSEYYDFYLAKDSSNMNVYNGLIDECLVIHFDFNNQNVFNTGTTSANTIFSLKTWTGATNTGYTLDTIGLTGIDNGLIIFDKLSSDTINIALLSALTGSTLIIPSGDTRLNLHKVSGMTGNYTYPMEYISSSGDVGNYMQFCGGFYQGFYKIDGTSYEILPNRVNKSWVAEFWLNPQDTCSIRNPNIYDITFNIGDQSGAITTTLINHGLNVGDLISVIDSPIDQANTNLSSTIQFAKVLNILDENTFVYASGKSPTPGVKNSYGKLYKYVIDFIEENIPLTIESIGFDRLATLTGLSENRPILINNISNHIDRFTPWNLDTQSDPFLTGYTSTFNYLGSLESGFTYVNNINSLSTTFSAISDITIYKLEEQKILNDDYPNNKGIFFYLGTRSENKFWNQFDGLNTGNTSGCTSGATEWCTIPKEYDVSIIDDVSNVAYPLNPPLIIITEITNQFLIYGRANSGNTCSSICNTNGTGFGTKLACNFTGDSIFVTTIQQKQTDFRNPFLIYNRAVNGRSCGPCGTNITGNTGVLACNYSGDSIDVTELDWASDVIDNALAFIIKDDGSIGYRLLTISGGCSGDTYISGCSIEESFSISGVVPSNIWSNISIRFIADETFDDCELNVKGPRKGKLMFYVNCRLKFTTDFNEFIAKRLGIDHWKKQIGVPFNISLGGGSQGLLESMTFDGQDPSDVNLCIQENFAGTFIGGISQFRFHICDLNWEQLKHNCDEECDRYDTCVGCSGI